MLYPTRLEMLKAIIGCEVEDLNGTIWTVHDVNIRNVADPLILLWDRERGGTKYVTNEEYSTFISVATN